MGGGGGRKKTSINSIIQLHAAMGADLWHPAPSLESACTQHMPYALSHSEFERRQTHLASENGAVEWDLSQGRRERTLTSSPGASTTSLRLQFFCPLFWGVFTPQNRGQWLEVGSSGVADSHTRGALPQ